MTVADVCERCGEATYNTTEHPCCVLWNIQPGDKCPACWEAQRWWRQRTNQRRRR